MMDNVDRRLALSAAAAGAGGAGQAPHRARRHRAGRCADPLRRCATARREAVALTESWLAAIQRAAYLASAELAAEKGAFPLFDREQLSRRRDRSRRCDEDVRDAIAAARHPQRAADLDRADRHDLAVRRQRLVAASSRCSPSATRRNVLQPDGTPARGGGRATTPTASSARFKGEDAPLPDYFVDAQTLTPGRSSGDAGGGAALRRQLDLQDHQRARPTSPSRRFKDVYLAGL